MIPYIIKVALILAGCLAFYKILLRRETFYRVNRFTLMICLLIAFALPLVPVPQQWSLRKNANESTIVKQQTPVTTPLVVGKPTASQVTPAPSTGSTGSAVQTKTTTEADSGPSISFRQFMNWMFWIYWFGVAIFAISFLFQIVVLLWRAYRNPVIIDGRYRIVELSGDQAPCSFGNTIFINPEKYDWETYQQIIQHEKIHIREKHTLDILFAEIVLIFQWFNPFAWIYRREVESNLEFMTDERLIEEKIDKTSYQLSLLKVSAPHFPLSLTTNYNQSILKKRIAMMNSKRSNLHTAWKYFFLLPLLALLACLLNEPMAQNKNKDSKTVTEENGMDTEGYWFATIKDDKVRIIFSDEEVKDDNYQGSQNKSFNSTHFNLSDLSNVPKGTAGTFSITREAGRMDFTGKFEGNTGMGRYKFNPDKAYSDHMSTELKEKLDEEDQLVFFFINVKKSYLAMLKSEGYSSVTKDDLIPLVALNIDAAFIKSIKDAGYKNVELEDLIPLKALNIDAAYIKEIRDAGYKNIELEQLVSFKAQGIDKDYIEKVRKSKGADGKLTDEDADDIVSFKAMNIDDEFINSLKAVGYTDLSNEMLVSMKAMGITADYIRTWQAAGFKNLEVETLVGWKSQNVTPEYIKSFESMGFKNIEPEEYTGLKALGVTPEYIRSFEAAGYKNIDLDKYTGLKALGITPEYIKSFEAIGFKDIDLDEITSVKATGVTPEYIKSMREKGFNYNTLEKYVRLKTID